MKTFYPQHIQKSGVVAVLFYQAALLKKIRTAGNYYFIFTALIPTPPFPSVLSIINMR